MVLLINSFNYNIDRQCAIQVANYGSREQQEVLISKLERIYTMTQTWAAFNLRIDWANQFFRLKSWSHNNNASSSNETTVTPISKNQNANASQYMQNNRNILHKLWNSRDHVQSYGSRILPRKMSQQQCSPPRQLWVINTISGNTSSQSIIDHFTPSTMLMSTRSIAKMADSTAPRVWLNLVQTEVSIAFISSHFSFATESFSSTASFLLTSMGKIYLKVSRNESKEGARSLESKLERRLRFEQSSNLKIDRANRLYPL